LLYKNIQIKIHTTVTPPFVLYGCETRSLTLRKEHRPRGFQNWVLMKTFEPQREKNDTKVEKTKNRVLMKTFEPQREKMTRKWRRLHNEEFYALYSSPNSIRPIK
jgi:hypothetical protein